ncbi:MAG: FliH/SctL family protein [Pseudohongiellaceae bacterium]|jgi:flagellar assembly protein FliH
MTSNPRKFSGATVSEWKTPQLVESEADSEHAGKSLEEIRQEAYDLAFQQGLEEGKKQGFTDMAQRAQVVENFLAALARPFDEQSEELAEYLALLAGRIAKSLVRRELRTTPETLMALVRDTVAALNTTEQEITIHLNPNNAPVIRDLIKDDSGEKSWRILDDPMISLNNCKISCRDSIIDADLDARISMIITQFLGDERNSSRE